MNRLDNIIISPPYTVKRSLPKNKDQALIPSFKKEQVYTQANTSYILTFKNCYVTYYGPILTGLRLASVLTSQMKEHPLTLFKLYVSCFKKIFLHKVKTVNKKCLVVHNNYVYNYYHWVTEVFFRVYLVKDLLLDYVLILPKPSTSVQVKMLKCLGPQVQIEEIEPENLIQAPEVVTPDYVSDYGNYQPELFREYANWILSKVIKTTFLSKKSRIYITRRTASYRRILNEEELIKKLEHLDFAIIDLETLDFEEQVSLFHTAALIVAPHGAGLTNLIYCKAKTTIVEIFPAGYLHLCYYTLADVFGLDYYYFKAENVKSNQTDKPYQFSMDVDVAALHTFLMEEVLVVNNI